MAERLSKDELARRLSALAPRMAPGAERVENLVRLTGGASMETWAFDAVGAGDAKTPLILRRRTRMVMNSAVSKPPLRREAEAIALAVEAGVPAPIVTYVCDEEADGLDEAYVMHRVAGETLGKKITSDPAFEPARGKLARQCGAALARIHSV